MAVDVKVEYGGRWAFAIARVDGDLSEKWVETWWWGGGHIRWWHVQFYVGPLSSFTGALLLQSSFLMVVRMATRLHVFPSSLPAPTYTLKTDNYTETYFKNASLTKEQETERCKFIKEGTHTHAGKQMLEHKHTLEMCHSHYPERPIEWGSLLPSSRSKLGLTAGWQKGGTVLT